MQKTFLTYSMDMYGKYGFVTKSPLVAFTSVIVLGLSAIIGTFGNILIILVIIFDKNLKTPDSVFILDLATSDMYVTTVAVPFSITAKIEGEEFFNSIPGLCQTIAGICTVSCVTSLMTIGLMSINRYFYICRNDRYDRIFTKRNCICMCISTYFVGGFLVLLNAAGIGDHGFDRKSLECIWDRMATFPYTVIFSITLVWIPSIIIGICYLKIFLYVRAHNKRVSDQIQTRASNQKRSFQLAKTLFVIYAVFTTCWAPYALLMVIDADDSFPHELHLYITMFAHLHPSLNWIIYYVTNKKFADAYKHLFRSSCRPNTVTPNPTS